MGGLRRIAKVVTVVVPTMTALYLGAALIIMGGHIYRLPEAISLILTSAFSPIAAVGAVGGYGMMRALTAGFERGVFATDAGIGIAPVLQASARTCDAADEGAVAMVAPVLAVLVCTITSLVLLVTGAWQEPGLQSTTMCTWAFKEGLGHPAAESIVILALFLFGFTTTLAWALCAEKATEYLFGLRAVRYFNILFILCIPIGALCKVELVWGLADLTVALMLLCNMIGIVGLSREVVKESQL